MKILNYFITLFVAVLILYSCGATANKKTSEEKEQPVVIANDSLEYQIIIIDPGFTSYLYSVAKPEGFYSQNYLESRNRAWVISWNSRVMSPQRYNPSIYENNIDYQQNTDYGYEVNYKLFNYFLFAQQKYKMNLGGGFRGNRIN
jgi:hypothetical protein